MTCQTRTFQTIQRERETERERDRGGIGGLGGGSGGWPHDGWVPGKCSKPLWGAPTGVNICVN